MKRHLSLAVALAALAGSFLLTRATPAADESEAGAAVEGQVVLAGDEVPKPRTLDDNDALKKSPDKAQCLKNGSIPAEDLVVNPDNKGVRWAFAWLAPPPDAEGKFNATGKLPPPPGHKMAKEVVLDQPCCQFIPHARGMQKGQTLRVKNSAPINHNVHWQGIKNPGGNVIVPPKASFPINGLEAEKLPMTVSCDIHPWMSARVGIFNHPYFDVTDENGKFKIKDAPEGEYRLMVWHEKIGWVAGRTGMPITIKKDGAKVGKIELKIP